MSTPPDIDYAPPPARSTPVLTLVVAWLVVIIPAAWGVTQTAIKSFDLFRSAPAPVPLTAPATSPATP